MSAAKATAFKVLETGIWKCRFRPFKSEPIDVRARSAAELVEDLRVLATKRADEKEKAAKAREEQRRAHQDAVAKTRAAVKELGATRFKVRREDVDSATRGYLWTCRYKSRITGLVHEVSEPFAEALVDAVRALVHSGGGDHG